MIAMFNGPYDTPQLEYPRASFDDLDEATAYVREFFPEATVTVTALGELLIETNLFELPDGSYTHRGADTEQSDEDDDEQSDPFDSDENESRYGDAPEQMEWENYN